MIGGYGRGGEFMPRVLHLSVRRLSPGLPRPGEKLDFLLSIHEEGTGITWQRNVAVSAQQEQDVLIVLQELYLWSLGVALTPERARELIAQVGRSLYDLFIGKEAKPYLDRVEPTAILMDVDETILNLPWELIASPEGCLAMSTPFGRLVTTRVLPKPGPDPIKEDRVVQVLVVENPTLDLGAAEKEVQAIKAIEGQRDSYQVKVDVLAAQEATRAALRAALKREAYDVLHFAGHASLNLDDPDQSALRFADGLLTANQVLDLPWRKPPYLVFNSACESGRAAGGRRLVDDDDHANGLAAAFLAAGVQAYAGYFWPVSDVGAALFGATFYEALFSLENVGLAFLAARERSHRKLGDQGDLTAYSAVLFGDAASKHRQEVFTAV